MPIAVTCSSCKRKLKAPDNAAGRKLKCPQCGLSIEVPEFETVDEEPVLSQEKRRLKKRARIVEEEERDESTEDDKPSRTILYLAIGGGCALILTVTIVMIIVMGRGTNKNDTNGDKQTVQAVVPQGGNGTDENGSSKEKGDKNVPAIPPGIENKKDEGRKKDADQLVTEDQAKGALKTVLDSWIFGDTVEKFKNEHPEITPPIAFALGPLFRAKMLRYEIGAVRKTALGHEFAVTLVFESKAGTEIKKGCRCTVWMLGGKLDVEGIETP